MQYKASKALKSPRRCYCFLCEKRFQLVLSRSEIFRLKKKAEESLQQGFSEAKARFNQEHGRPMSPLEEKMFFKSFLDPLWIPCPDCLSPAAT